MNVGLLGVNFRTIFTDVVAQIVGEDPRRSERQRQCARAQEIQSLVHEQTSSRYLEHASPRFHARVHLLVRRRYASAGDSRTTRSRVITKDSGPVTKFA